MNVYLGKMQLLILEMEDILKKKSYSKQNDVENCLRVLRSQLQDLEAVIERVRYVFIKISFKYPRKRNKVHNKYFNFVNSLFQDRKCPTLCKLNTMLWD